MKKVYYELKNFTYGVTLILFLVLMCSCASNKTSRVGTAVGNAAISSIPDTASGAVRGSTSTAISGGKVLQGARSGAASGIGSAAGATTGAIIRELLK
ncbi:MAG: hypothetical protein ACE5KZ_11750 [Candidatus Scalinduaceae bacterium]